MKRLLIAVPLIFCTFPAWGADRIVLVYDDSGNGTLRRNIEIACDQAGDDTITFTATTADQVTIPLRTPLVIPSDCRGGLTIKGSSSREVILDGSRIRNGRGILIVRSWGNEISRLTFTGYEGGAGLALEDGDNRVSDCSFGVTRRRVASDPNGTGIRVAGDWNVLTDNIVSANRDDGILVEGNANTLQGNRIGDYPDACLVIDFPEGRPEDYPTFLREISNDLFFPIPIVPGLFQWFGDTTNEEVCGNRGTGIRISGDRNLLGGSDLADGNRILFNDGGGIVVEAEGRRNRFSRSVIAHNIGKGIRLIGAANDSIASLSALSSFPVESEPAAGVFRYTLFGQGARRGNRVELYQVALGETDDSEGRGEGGRFLEGFIAGGETFTRTVENATLPPGSRITALVCDDAGNCSEFSPNAPLGRDSDHDGLLDPVEDPDGDLRIDRNETDPLSADTDGDGLADSVEDRNGNGRVDPRETNPAKQDTDGDGLSDFIETGGDGVFDSVVGDTDPLNRYTDGDGLTDGNEDLNRDGRIQIGETDPRNRDTDGDGRPDR